MDTWTIAITSPMGETSARLQFEQTSTGQITGLTGEMTGKGGSGPMEKGQIDGNTVSWACKIEKPVPMTLKFKGTRLGDKMTGKVKFGLFASGTFTAARI